MKFLRELYKMIRCAFLVVLKVLADLEFHLERNTTSPLFGSIWLKKRGVQFEHPIALGHSLYIRNHGNLSLGQRCSFGSFTRIWNYNPISIGDDFMCAGGLTINTASHDPVNLAFIEDKIRIGNRVWCGLNVTILSGVTIGNDVVIGAGSVVISDLPSNCIAVGVPAKKIKNLNRSADQEIWQLSARD